MAGVFTSAAIRRSSNSGAGGDPFVACLDDFFEIGVGEDPLRHVAAGADDGDRAARLAGPRSRDFLHCSA